MCINFRLKQLQHKEKPQTEASWISSDKTNDSATNCVKSLSVYHSLVPYIDSDKDESDNESSSLSGDDNPSHVSGKTKHSTDQKVPDKKPLVMRPKEDPCDQIVQETTPKKCLVLKPPNDHERESLPTKKCLVLKPKDEEDPLEVKTEPEPIKKCLVRIPKNDSELSTSKVFHSNEGKDSDKKNRRRENGFSESDNVKSSKVRLDNNYNG